MIHDKYIIFNSNFMVFESGIGIARLQECPRTANGGRPGPERRSERAAQSAERGYASEEMMRENSDSVTRRWVWVRTKPRLAMASAISAIFSSLGALTMNIAS